MAFTQATASNPFAQPGLSPSPSFVHAAPAPSEELVQDVALELINRNSESAPNNEVTEVMVSGLQIGSKKLNFEFSVLSMGEKAPVNLEVLKQLALGCKRTITAAYDRRLQTARQLQEQGKLTRTEKKDLQKAQIDLAIFNNIRSFVFEIENETPVLIITGLNPHTHREVKLHLKLDPEFDGAAQAVQATLRSLKAEQYELQHSIQEFETQLEAVRAQNTALTETLQHLQANLDDLPAAPDRTTEQQAEFRRLEAQRNELERILQDSRDHEAVLEQESARYNAETQARREQLEAQINSLRKSHLHKVVIQAYDRQRTSAEGTIQTKYKPVIELYQEVEGQEEVQKFDEIELTDPKYPVIFYGEQVASHAHIFKDITHIVEQAQKGSTEKTKKFAETIAGKLKKKEQNPNTPQYSPQQLMRLREQMAAMQNQQ